MGRLPALVHLTAMDAVLCECALVRLRSDSVWRASFMASAFSVLFRAPESVCEQERQRIGIDTGCPECEPVVLRMHKSGRLESCSVFERIGTQGASAPLKRQVLKG